jgi:hypothetical protein
LNFAHLKKPVGAIWHNPFQIYGLKVEHKKILTLWLKSGTCFFNGLKVEHDKFIRLGLGLGLGLIRVSLFLFS